MSDAIDSLDGLRDGWRDFLGGFEILAITPEEMWESPDGSCVVEFVRLRGRPKAVSAAIEEAAGAVRRLRDGKLATVEFHMDRARALRAAGLAPDQ